jgi:phage shock protein PspC (stress-responsive transcriptional regulator)
MKKTININLGGSAFIIDEDAYGLLKNYLDDIASRLPEHDAEVINDVESRLSEIFQNNLSIRSQVIDSERVRRAMSVMGRPEEFGEKTHIDEMKETLRNEQQASAPRRLYRNLNDRWLGGVCSGVALYMGVDPTLMRVILILLLLAGIGFFAYIILWIVLPKAYLNPDGSVNHL